MFWGLLDYHKDQWVEIFDVVGDEDLKCTKLLQIISKYQERVYTVLSLGIAIPLPKQGPAES